MNEGTTLLHAVLCRPGEAYVSFADASAHHFLERPDLRRAQAQHDALVQLLTDHHVRVTVLPELEGHPNAVFTRDPLLITPAGYVTLRMGLPTRRGEEAWLAAAVDALGIPQAGAITRPGTVEGGDVILAGRVAFVGRSARTNEAGFHQLASLLQHMGYEVRSTYVPDEYLHIGGAMSMIAPDRVLACPGVFPPDFFDGFHVIWAPRGTPGQANVLCLAPNVVVADSAQTQVIDTLRGHGVEVHVLDLSEFAKGAGGPTCLVQPIARNGG
ncbi:MAG: hypothetical protein GXO55_08960 [Chloroflexi bacterium]|nr:hypothetical protein [Chloroflexota bacterium]